LVPFRKKNTELLQSLRKKGKKLYCGKLAALENAVVLRGNPLFIQPRLKRTAIKTEPTGEGHYLFLKGISVQDPGSLKTVSRVVGWRAQGESTKGGKKWGKHKYSNVVGEGKRTGLYSKAPERLTDLSRNGGRNDEREGGGY